MANIKSAKKRVKVNATKAANNKAANSALEEMDENDIDTSGYSTYTHTKTGGTTAESDILEYMKAYFDDVDNTDFALNFQNGIAVCCAAKSGAYFGTSPIVYTNKNYPNDASLSKALAAAQSKYTVQHPSTDSSAT